MSGKPLKKAFVLDPRTLLKPEFDEEIVEYLKVNHFTELVRQSGDLNPKPDVITLDKENLLNVFDSLEKIAGSCMNENGRLDLQVFIKKITQEGIMGFERVVQEGIVEVLKSQSNLLDAESFGQIADNGKVVFVLGSEANPTENFMGEAIAHTIQASQKGKRTKEIGIGNIFLGDHVIRNDIVIINTGDQGKIEKPNRTRTARIVEITKGLADIGLRPMVVETDLNTLTRLEKEERENKPLHEKQMSLALIGPAKLGELSTRIRRFDTLKDYTTPPSRQEGRQIPAAGIPPMG